MPTQPTPQKTLPNQLIADSRQSIASAKGRSAFGRNSGLTLIELIMSLTIGSILIIFIFSSFTALIKTQRLLLGFNYMQTTNSNLLRLIKDDLRWGDIQLDSDFSPTQFTVTTNQGQATYTWNQPDQQLTRQLTTDTGTTTEVIHPQNLVIADFEVINRTPANHLPLIQVTITTKHTSRNLQQLVLEKTLTVTRKSKQFML
jgi:prepilin-type N-terminal cleavage/methylation domain-containing protein